jgi:hypothetical protein
LAVFDQQAVQKGRARARQAGDHQRGGDLLIKDLGRALFFIAQAQQILQKPYRVPADRGTPEEAQRRLLAAGPQQLPHRVLERDIAEIIQSGAASGLVDQMPGDGRLAPASEHASDHVGDCADSFS